MSASADLIKAIACGDAISRSALLDKAFVTSKPTFDRLNVRAAVDTEDIESAPALDVVLLGTYEQCRWERDLAMQQLAQAGIPFGGSTHDNVETRIARHGKWIIKCEIHGAFDDDGWWEDWSAHCSECGMIVYPDPCLCDDGEFEKALEEFGHCSKCGSIMDEFEVEAL